MNRFEKKYISRAPYRISFGGGGSDISEYFRAFEGAVINATVDLYCTSSIQLINSDNVIFQSYDLDIEENVKLSEVNNSDLKLFLHKSIYIQICKLFNNGELIPLKLSTYADLPVGSGLGASSTLVVSVIKCFSELLSLKLSPQQIADLAYSIERDECRLKGGKQDMYAAAFGGLNFFEFHKDDSVSIQPINLNNNFISKLESMLILFYTGISRESAKIISDQSKLLTNEDKINAMHNIKKEAYIIKEKVINNDLLGLMDSLKIGWENKKQTSSLVSNNFLDNLIDKCLDAGALAGKISGAGGGGFIFFFVDLENKKRILDILNNSKGVVYNCHFVDHGAISWQC